MKPDRNVVLALKLDAVRVAAGPSLALSLSRLLALALSLSLSLSLSHALSHALSLARSRVAAGKESTCASAAATSMAYHACLQLQVSKP